MASTAKRKTVKVWVGLVENKIDDFHVGPTENGYGDQLIGVFRTKKAARRCYEHVEPAELTFEIRVRGSQS